jgi:hypothetical protein
MRSLTCLMTVSIACLTAMGCGNSGFINARGHIIKGGQPYLLPEGQGFRIFFMPEDTSGTRYDSYSAAYDPEDGSFLVTGKDGRGLPPGKYQVDIQLRQGKEDLLGGRLPPVPLEITRDNKELVIDLDTTSFDKVLEQTKRQMSRKSRPRST